MAYLFSSQTAYNRGSQSIYISSSKTRLFIDNNNEIKKAWKIGKNYYYASSLPLKIEKKYNNFCARWERVKWKCIVDNIFFVGKIVFFPSSYYIHIISYWHFSDLLMCLYMCMKPRFWYLMLQTKIIWKTQKLKWRKRPHQHINVVFMLLFLFLKKYIFC